MVAILMLFVMVLLAMVVLLAANLHRVTTDKELFVKCADQVFVYAEDNKVSYEVAVDRLKKLVDRYALEEPLHDR